jgi:RimJ/RimL family protein N-acetyltransferase
MITVRPAGLDDAEPLLAWANDPLTRQWSRRHEVIARDEHERWLAARLGAPHRARLWIGERDGAPVGVVRVERVGDDELEVSITVAPAQRRRGLARPLLDAGLAEARRAFPGSRFRAEILRGNEASVALFTGAGFRPVQRADDEPADASVLRFERA